MGTSASIQTASGFSGYSGATGTSGFSGPTGTSGYSGPTGTSGYSGFSGATPAALACFDQSFDPADIDLAGTAQDNDFAIAWLPKRDMDITGIGMWATNVGASDAAFVGIYDNSDNLLEYTSGVSASMSAGPNMFPLATGISVFAGQKYWLVLKTIQGSMNFGRTTNLSHITIAKEKFDSAESLPVNLSGFFVSTAAPWVSLSGTCS